MIISLSLLLAELKIVKIKSEVNIKVHRNLLISLTTISLSLDELKIVKIKSEINIKVHPLLMLSLTTISLSLAELKIVNRNLLISHNMSLYYGIWPLNLFLKWPTFSSLKRHLKIKIYFLRIANWFLDPFYDRSTMYLMNDLNNKLCLWNPYNIIEKFTTISTLGLMKWIYKEVIYFVVVHVVL